MVSVKKPSMKRQKRRKPKRTKPTANKLSVLHQLCNFIPGQLVSKLARKHGVDKKARHLYAVESCRGAVVCPAHPCHRVERCVCDGLEHHRGLLGGIRGAVPPSRNGFSYANKHRDAKMAERSCSGSSWATCRDSVRALGQGGAIKDFRTASRRPSTWLTRRP